MEVVVEVVIVKVYDGVIECECDCEVVVEVEYEVIVVGLLDVV